MSVRSWDDALQVGKTTAEPLTKVDTTTGGTHFVGRATDWVHTLLYAAHLDQRPPSVPSLPPAVSTTGR